MAFERVKEFYRKHERWVPLTFFLAGFTFDAIVLPRIDHFLGLVHQATYLLIAGWIIFYDSLENAGIFTPHPWVEKLWRYREAFLHFILGTLMNCYTLFYFKSASVFTSIAFVALLVATLTVTEFKKFGHAQRAFHFGLLALCSVSYFIYLIPILFGWVGVVPFIGAILASASVLGLLYRKLNRHLNDSFVMVFDVLIPFAAVHVFFLLLYFTKVIPPVPLSLEFVGIYHDVKKESGNFRVLSLEKSRHWWQRNGEDPFLARPGDKIYCFARIFSPTRFKDQVQVRWLFNNPKTGWENRDVIPISISGGRNEGFRGYTSKGNYEPGDWRVQIETTDSREIGRIYFSVVADHEADERVWLTEEK